jgi:hypothetical protein
MMKNSKMSLDAFKANAKNESVELALESVQGGGLYDCHGKIGQVGKKIGNWLEKQLGSPIDSPIDESWL